MGRCGKGSRFRGKKEGERTVLRLVAEEDGLAVG